MPKHAGDAINADGVNDHSASIILGRVIDHAIHQWRRHGTIVYREHNVLGDRTHLNTLAADHSFTNRFEYVIANGSHALRRDDRELNQLRTALGIPTQATRAYVYVQRDISRAAAIEARSLAEHNARGAAWDNATPGCVTG